MNYRHILPLIILLASACTQIQAPREASRERPSPQPRQSQNATTEKTSSANSQRTKYRELYNQFKEQYREIKRHINGNRLALRGSGERSVEALEQMFSLLSSRSQSRLEDVRDNYVEAWDQFDERSPSTGKRTRLRQAKDRVTKEFNPSKIELKTSKPSQNKSINTPDSDSSASAGKQNKNKNKIIVRNPSDEGKIRVENPDRYRRLFQKWRVSHKKFKNGLEASDPLIQSTFRTLEKTIKKMIEEVESGKDKLSYYYLSQYELIYENRDRFVGTPKKSDHLTFLKKQFIQEFAPSSSN